MSYPDFEDWRRDSRVFDGMAAAFATATISLGRDGAVPDAQPGEPATFSAWSLVISPSTRITVPLSSKTRVVVARRRVEL